MLSLGNLRPVFGLLTVPALSLRRPRLSVPSSCLFYSSFIGATPTTPHRTFSAMPVAHLPDDLFNYTSGGWIINDAVRRRERRRVFNVDGLRQLAAQSVGRSPDDIIDLKKLAEGGFNRTFLITMHDGFQMVARIPYLATVPKYFAVASEVATMDLLRSSGLPIPEVYGYSAIPDNAAETEYIFMEFIKGTTLSGIWFDLEEKDIISILYQLVKLESKMMSITFPASGSLYYTKDLENVAKGLGVLLQDKDFCVGPDTRLHLWYGRRSQLDVDRGPYINVEDVLLKAADKELAYLERFGKPLLPFERVRREGYQYQKQSPSDHIKNLGRYSRLAPSFIPRDPTLSHFRIRHPDLQLGNIIVVRSPDSNLRIVSLIDWQHTAILPVFLHAGIPQPLQNYNDSTSFYLIQPSLPENFDSLDENQQMQEKDRYLRRLVHYHYIKNTEKYNKLHHRALLDPMGTLPRRLFCHAGEPWEGETLALEVALIEAAGDWKMVTGGSLQCPIVFNDEDIHKATELDKVQKGADEALEMIMKLMCIGSDGWVSAKYYEEVVIRCKELKEQALAMAEEEDGKEERARIAAHWPLDDMDESDYM